MPIFLVVPDLCNHEILQMFVVLLLAFALSRLRLRLCIKVRLPPSPVIQRGTPWPASPGEVRQGGGSAPCGRSHGARTAGDEHRQGEVGLSSRRGLLPLARPRLARPPSLAVVAVVVALDAGQHAVACVVVATITVRVVNVPVHPRERALAARTLAPLPLPGPCHLGLAEVVAFLRCERLPDEPGRSGEGRCSGKGEQRERHGASQLAAARSRPWRSASWRTSERRTSAAVSRSAATDITPLATRTARWRVTRASRRALSASVQRVEITCAATSAPVGGRPGRLVGRRDVLEAGGVTR